MNMEPLIVKKRTAEKPRVISVRIEADVLMDIDKAAGESGISRNELINRMLRYAMENVKVVS